MRRSLGTVATLLAGLGAAGCEVDAPSERSERAAEATDGLAAQAGCAGCAWVQTMGGSAAPYWLERLAKLAVDAQGNVLVGGTFEGSLRVGGETLVSAGDSDVFLARLSPAGAVLWARRFGDAERQELRALAFDPAGNALVTGNFSGTLEMGGATLTSERRAMFLAKLDPAGNAIWSKALEGEDDSIQEATAIAADRQGNVLLSASVEGTLDLGGVTVDHGGSFPFVAKLSPEGAPRWTKSFTCSVDQEITHLAADEAGDVRFAGTVKATCVDGIRLRGRAQESILVGSIEAGGKLGWVQLAGNGRFSWVSGMDVDPAGRMAVAVEFEGEVELGGLRMETAGGQAASHVVQLDAQGRGRWATALPFDASGVAAMPSGESIVVGRRSLPTIPGEIDEGAAAARLGNDGALRWTFQGSGPGRQRALRVAPGGQQRAVVLAGSDGGLDLGCGPQAGGGGPLLAVAGLDLRERCAE